MDTYDPLSPVQVEQRLRRLVSELTRAQQALAQARDAEVDAEVAHKKARLRAGENAPKARRGEVTVGERDELIDAATVVEWEALRRAQISTANAQDYLRVVREQASVVQSLSASIREAYRVAGAA